jgi:hypothetical protein
MDFKFPSSSSMSGLNELIDSPDDDSQGTKLHNLPAEIHAKILRLLDPIDVLAYASTCKSFHIYAEGQQLW